MQKNYEHYIYINLEREEDIASIFEQTIDPLEIIKYIEIKKGITINIESTIIFFDEIQVSERAITSLKYFCEDKIYHIVCAGSLLGVKIRRFKSSFPVGKVIIKILFPVDFEEFLIALNKEKLLNEIKRCFDSSSKMLDSLHNEALELYKSYLCIGGMPQAVSDYIEKDYNIMAFNREIHSNIITAYIADMRKYTNSSEEIIKIQSIYENMPIQLGSDNRKFKYSTISSEGNKRQYELPLDWLVASNMLIKCSKIKLPQAPLKVYEEDDNFKMYLSDVGLLNYLSKVTFADIMCNNEFLLRVRLQKIMLR